MSKKDVANRVTDYTFAAVSDLASYANDLEEIGYIKQAEKLRRISGELENVSHAIFDRANK